MMLRASSLRLAGAAALLFAVAPAFAATGDAPQNSQAAGAPSDQSADTAAAPTEAAKPKAEERKICRRIEASESRVAAKRICMTAAEWKQADF